ncbi:MAG: hypothetical protein QOG18_1145 [Microbacteriaceae bacterium]|nr:hypothetical protein [Microbacteriaceae bacterium]MCU1507553.1 hypothetical protein [Microbacteriaceae bacterium]MCU1580912.1 hypothetical protein [Microbacteriaceae bacterium]MDQ1526532.1 hypothetical protein [Microbacteriaceae bacterium]
MLPWRVNSQPESVHSATFSWVDPRVALEQLPRLSGLEYLSRMAAGEIPGPPIASVMQFELKSVEIGTVVFECRPAEAHFNPLGTIHGGLSCTLLDTVLGCAAHSTLPAGTAYTSIDIAVSYLRPIQPHNGPLVATGRVVKSGGRVIFAEASIVGNDGKVLATATSSLLVFPHPEKSAG